MKDFEDDFGELYAGVEAQAVSAINGVPDFAQYNTEPDEDINDNNNNAKNATHSSELGFISDSKTPNSICEELDEKVSVLEANEDYSGSDSEDDLNIVLNDEDCKDIKFPAGRGYMKNDEFEDEDDDDGFVAMKEYKYVRTQGSTCPSNVKPNESVGLLSSMLVRGDHDSNMCNQRKGSSSQITCIRGTPSSVVAQNRYGFRLPRCRTILDVNIESFEEKPWRHPKVDIKDYFNFGFDEDSWKQYCSSLGQLRRGIPVSDSSKYYQAQESGSKYEKFTLETMSKEMNHAGSMKFASPSSRFTDCGPKGKAIQIEDSSFERQPSFDMRHPRNWDSDVVIQITVQDLTEKTSNSGEEQGRTNNNAPEASKNAEFDANGSRIIPSSNTSEEDDLLLETLEGNIRLDRCSQQTSASHLIKIGSDNHERDQIVDLNEYDHKEVNAISLEAIEMTNKATKSVGRSTFYAGQCMMEAQLSLGDDCQLNPNSSCFASDSEASRNSSVHFDPEDIPTLARSSVNSHTKLCESVTSSFKNSKGNAMKRKLVDIKDYSTCKSPARKEHKHQDRRLDSVVEPKMHKKDDNDTEDLYDRDPRVNYHSRMKRLRDFGCTDREDISGYKESKVSCHNGVRYAGNHIQTVNGNYLDRKGSHKYPDKLDPHVIKTWSKREYFCENRDTDWHHFGRTQFIKERSPPTSPLTSRDSRGLYSRYSSYTVEGRDTQWKRKSNKRQFKKIPNHSGGCSDYKYEDHCVGENFGGYFSSNDLKRNASDEFDERQFSHVRRELENLEERVGYVDSPISYLDDSYSGKTEYEYCGHRENQYLSHQSDRELYTGDEGRWSDSISSRNDVSYSRITDERYWRHGRKIYSVESKESDCFDGHDNADGTEDTFYPNDHLRWRRSNCHSEVLHWTKNQLTIKRRGDKFYSEKASFSSQKYTRHEKFHPKYGSSHDELHIDDMKSEQHRLIHSVNCINRSSKMYRGKHEQTILKCRDSSDLGVGEGKSSGRCSKGRTLMRNGRLENMDSETGGERTTLMDSSESEKVRAVQFDTPKVGCNQNNEKGLDKFPVTAQNDDLGVEEGQILTEEPNTGYPLHRKHAPEYTAQAHNVKKRMFDSEIASSGNKAVESWDKRILETKAKMEKRWERFKEPITLKKEPDKLSKPEVDLIVAAETKQHRPARRRRWGGV